MSTKSAALKIERFDQGGVPRSEVFDEHGNVQTVTHMRIVPEVMQQQQPRTHDLPATSHSSRYSDI